MATKIQTPAPNKNIQFQLNANTFTRTGYSFLGWNTNWQATTAQYEDNANATFSSDTDLYAIWKEKELSNDSEWEIYDEGRGAGNQTSRGEDPVGYNLGSIDKSINKMDGQVDEHTFTMQQLVNRCGCADSPLCYYWVKLARYPLYRDGTRATNKVTYYLVQKRTIWQDRDTIWHIGNHTQPDTGISNPLYGEVTGVGFSGYPEAHENFQISVDGKSQVTINATIDPNSRITAYSGIQTLKLLGSISGDAYNTGVSVGDNLQLVQIYRSYYDQGNGYWEVFAKNGQTYKYISKTGSNSYQPVYTVNNDSDDTIVAANSDTDIYTIWQSNYPLYRLNDDGSITPMSFFYEDNGKEHGEFPQ